jgi:hypothetical protein
VDFLVDRDKSNHAPQPRTAFLNDAMQHEQKIIWRKRIVIASCATARGTMRNSNWQNASSLPKLRGAKQHD